MSGAWLYLVGLSIACPSHSSASSDRDPQAPVWGSPTKPRAFAGKATPICAVYMSANQLAKPVPPEGIPDPTINLGVPDTILQPWFQGSGNSFAVDFADSLFINGYCDISDRANFDPLDTTRLNWSAHALRMLVSE